MAPGLRFPLFVFLLAIPMAGFGGVQEAVAYLEAEVPRWKVENNCYSCHNNGDGARVLLLAKGGRENAAVRDTLAYLQAVDQWPSVLSPLALIQYTSALGAAAGSGDTPGFRKAVQRIAAAQKADGHWEMDAEASAGSPVTYGPVLGTVLAKQLLSEAGINSGRASEWLSKVKAEHPMDLAALVMWSHQKLHIDKLVSLQGKDGSWNGGEVFDTALAVIALQKDAPATASRGREWLLKNQLEPGGWRGTTRPAGGQSYAQHISTTAWALQALLSGEQK